MSTHLIVLITTAVIVSLALLIGLLLIASVLRRFLNERKYRALDRLKRDLAETARHALASDSAAPLLRQKPGSLAWQALEAVLLDLLREEPLRDRVVALFSQLGYVAYHEARLAKRNRLVRATSIDALGRMRSASSVPRLVLLLGCGDSEILTVTVRSLSRIGSAEALAAIIERLPVLLGSSLVTRKAMESCLLLFGTAAIPRLVQISPASVADPWVISCVLEALSQFPPDPRSAQYASALLSSPNAEVRSKALKVLCAAGPSLPRDLIPRIMPLLDDPVWFVRIQAVKTVETLGLRSACPKLGLLLSDGDWHVRDQAAVALMRFPESALEIFLDVLRGTDRYAKDSVCEQIEKTGFCDRLMQDLVGEGPGADRSRELLSLMQQLNFSTPFREYLQSGEDERIKQELVRLGTAGGA